MSWAMVSETKHVYFFACWAFEALQNMQTPRVYMAWRNIMPAESATLSALSFISLPSEIRLREKQCSWSDLGISRLCPQSQFEQFEESAGPCNCSVGGDCVKPLCSWSTDLHLSKPPILNSYTSSYKHQIMSNTSLYSDSISNSVSDFISVLYSIVRIVIKPLRKRSGKFLCK